MNNKPEATTEDYDLEQQRQRSRQTATVDSATVGIGRYAAAVQIGELAAVVLGQDQEVMGGRCLQVALGHELVGG